MLSNILIELLLHWLSFLPGLILFTMIICGVSVLNIFVWIPLLIYFIYIQVKLPTFKEIDYWTELRESLSDIIYLKSDNYNKVFQADFESSSNPNPSLNPDPKPRLLVWHPHGIQVISHIIHKLCIKSPLFNFLKNSKTTVHSMTFQVPIIRELFLFYGCIPATKEYITHYLEKGQSVSIFPGGVKEMDYCNSDNMQNKCYLKSRKGYLEIAKSGNYELIPIYTWGEQEFLTTSSKGSRFKWIINLFNKIFSAISGYSTDISALELCNINNIWKWNKVYFGMESSHTYTFVGKSIKTDNSDEYIHNLQRLYKLVQIREKSNKPLIIN
jgi:hypothetical protein